MFDIRLEAQEPILGIKLPEIIETKMAPRLTFENGIVVTVLEERCLDGLLVSFRGKRFRHRMPAVNVIGTAPRN